MSRRCEAAGQCTTIGDDDSDRGLRRSVVRRCRVEHVDGRHAGRLLVWRRAADLPPDLSRPCGGRVGRGVAISMTSGMLRIRQILSLAGLALGLGLPATRICALALPSAPADEQTGMVSTGHALA